MRVSIGACTNGLLGAKENGRSGPAVSKSGGGYLLAIAATRTVRRAL
jgi:hypothetical protein